MTHTTKRIEQTATCKAPAADETFDNYNKDSVMSNCPLQVYALERAVLVSPSLDYEYCSLLHPRIIANLKKKKSRPSSYHETYTSY